MAKTSRELQFSTQQMIGVFLGILALGVFVFLLGISIGKKQALLGAGAGPTPGVKTETAVPRTPLSADAGRSDIQKELEAHTRVKDAAPAKASPSPAPLENPTPTKPAENPAEKPATKAAVTVPDKPAEKPKPAASKAAPAEITGGWFVQVAAAADRPAAAAFAEKLQKDGYPTLLIEPTAKDKKSIYRVRVGPFGTKNEAEASKNRLTEAMKKKKSDYFLVKG
jgi:cell division septation protein DedD